MKKSIAILLILVFCLSLASCAPGSSNSTASGSPSDSPAPVSTALATTSSTSPDAGSDTLKIGVLANETGWFSAFDATNVYDIKAYAQTINDAGGLKVGDKTYKIELDIQDGQSDATGCRNAAQILTDNGCKYVIATQDFFVEGALDIFEKAGVMNIQAQNNLDLKAMGPQLKYTYSFFNGCVANYDGAVQALLKDYPQVKSVVYCSNDDGNNEPKEAQVKAAVEKYGLTYIDKPVIYDANATDFTATALQVISTGADALMGNAAPNNIGSILKEVRNSGSDMVCAAIVGLPANVLLAIAGEDASTYAFTTGPDVSSEKNVPELMWKVYSNLVNVYGAEVAGAFTGNFSNSLYVLTNLMTGAKSVEVADVMAYWDTLTTVETLFGTGKIGGEQIYGIKRTVATPQPISMLVDGKVVFSGWYETEVK